MSENDLMLVLSFSVTVALGVVSIVLAAFAIWMGRHFDEKSSTALDAIKDLATRIRSTIDVSVSQQHDFSAKMLDSILTGDQYGPRTTENAQAEALASTIRAQLESTEQRITGAVESTVRELLNTSDRGPKELQDALASIRHDISQLTEAAASTASSPITLPDPVVLAFRGWQEFPAHFPILAAIIKENAHSQSELEQLQDKYHFPGNFERGTENLLEAGVIHGSLSGFEIPAYLRGALEAWVDSNWPMMVLLIQEYLEKGDDRGVTDREREVAQQLLI